MYSQLIKILLIGCIIGVGGSQDSVPSTCFTNGASNCSAYTICIEVEDNNIHPGRLKTVEYYLFVPPGLTTNASVHFKTSTDMSVIISDVKLAFQDNNLTMTNGSFELFVTKISDKRVSVSTEAVFYFGDVECNATREFITNPTDSIKITDPTTSSPITTPRDPTTSAPITTPRDPTASSPITTPRDPTASSPITTPRDTTTSSPITNPRDPTTSAPITNPRDPTTSSTITTPRDPTTSSTITTPTDPSTSAPITTLTDPTTSPPITTPSVAEVSNVTDSINNTDTTTSSSVTTSSSAEVDLCSYCLLKLAATFLMANTIGVFENPTRNVSATLVSDNVTLGTGATMVLRPTNISSNKFNFSSDILDVEELPLSSTKLFKLQAMFQNPLSAYKLVLQSQKRTLQIASFRISSVGEHFKDIISPPFGPDPEDSSFCDGNTATRTIIFDYLPNKGAFDDNASAVDDIVEFEVMLSMTGGAILGKVHPFHIDMEIDHVHVMNLTKYFNATAMNPIDKINITTSQSYPLIAKSATGTVTLTWDVPLLSSGGYAIHTSTKRYTGTGGNGLIAAGVQLAAVGSNLPCLPISKHWKWSGSGSMKVTNIPYTNNSMSSANRFGFKVSVVTISQLVDAYSSHEVLATISYPGEGSPQSFKFYFNITGSELFTTPNVYGNLPLGIYFHETCRSITPSTELELILHTRIGHRYGRLLVELPIPADLMGQSFVMCYFGIVWEGRNIVMRYDTTIKRSAVDIIENVLVDISPLTNIYFATYDGLTVNYVTMKMVATFINGTFNINNLPNNFAARVISNNVTIWTGIVPITHPSIAYYPSFIVVTEIVKLPSSNPANIVYHYSRNGTFYHQQSITWDGGTHGFQFEFPNVVSHFYFTTDACTVICNVTTVWLPLRDYITIVQDDNDTMLKILPNALDQDLDTCFALPLPGDSPSMLWMIITQPSLFGVTSQRFVVHVTGHGIECGNIGQRSLHVGTSGPAYNHQCNFESDVSFCTLLLRIDNATMTQCDIECECDTLVQCSNVHILMQTTNTDVWSLCELTIRDVEDS